jgi:hypothetical protein
MDNTLLNALKQETCKVGEPRQAVGAESSSGPNTTMTMTNLEPEIVFLKDGIVIIDISNLFPPSIKTRLTIDSMKISPNNFSA